ncbi:hypothetical protein [Oryzomicrobium sp.]|uniref:hypothetical protein n=1 Tax=Oryzomicrobium sp. TaxID=1911578 RepID=UPI0025FBE43F|nr:hypothetical protein [Oryzomicrobium sp.]MCE1244076.1 hypothetical protein [Oryzomicrobium sp.]
MTATTTCADQGSRGEGCEECVENFLTRVGASRLGLETGRAFDCMFRELEEIEREAARFYRRTGWMAGGMLVILVVGLLAIGA